MSKYGCNDGLERERERGSNIEGGNERDETDSQTDRQTGGRLTPSQIDRQIHTDGGRGI